MVNNGIKGEFIDDRIRFIKGFFEDTTNQYEGKIAFLHIDCDLYQPHLTALEAFYEKVQKGGIIVFDDYGTKFVGATKAVDEFFKDKPETLFLSDYYNSFYVIKN